MEIRVHQDQLTQALQVVHRAAASKTASLPVLSGIYLRATAPDLLYLAATDLEIGIALHIKVQVVEEGAIVLPARILTEAVRRLPNLPLHLKVDMQNFTARLSWGARSSFDIHGVEPEQFPSLPEEKEKWSVNLRSEALKKGIQQVIFAASQSDRRPILSGVLFEIKDDGLKTAAVDYARLVVKRVQVDGHIRGEGARNTVPARMLNEVMRSLGTEDREVEVRFSPSHALFIIRDLTISARLLEGQFPDYQPFIPKADAYIAHATISTEEFLQACDRMALVATDDDRTVRLQFEEEGLLLSASSADVGQAVEELPARCTGQPPQVCFNVRYLQEGLRNLEAETFMLNLTGKEAAATITLPDQDDFIYIIMPLRSEGEDTAV